MTHSVMTLLRKHPDVLLILAMIGILVVLFSPIPPRVLDFLLLINLGFALLLLIVTFYVEKPVQFSTYPSLLLITTLFRLSLNIAATRLILGSADAGRVIGAIGAFVVQGNYVIGLVVFLILVVVQYVVVTSGAQRVAEVAARFTLDSMPGQQMSIDADLNMGFIDQEEAQRRRRNIEKEANFYGAMDGASKFVKGDAIAGIVILLIDIFAGLAVGVAQQGMSWPDAARTFTLLTIGDGIVTQVPALVIAIGTGIIVTRSGTDSRLSQEVFLQLGNFPRALVLVAIALAGIGLLPGMPLIPVLILASCVAVAATLLIRRAPVEQPSAHADKKSSPHADTSQADLAEIMTIHPVEVRVGQGLIALVNATDSAISDQITVFRKHFALEAGVVLPPIHFGDDKRLPALGYEISIFGVKVGSAELMPECSLALHATGQAVKLPGKETRDPSYELPAVWIDDVQKEEARRAGYTLVDPTTVFVTHLTELMRRNAASLLTRAETALLLERVRERNGGLVEELIPGILSMGEIQKVLQNLLREKVSIRNLEGILEVLADAGRLSRDTERLTEIVRQRHGAVICQALVAKSGDLQVITLDPGIEQKIAGAIQRTDESTQLILEPQFAEMVIGRLSTQVQQAMKNGVMPVLLCAPELRRHLRSVTERVLPHLAVLSMTEVPPSIALRSFGVVRP